jgi:hypothetical protein
MALAFPVWGGFFHERQSGKINTRCSLGSVSRAQKKAPPS